jgi:hypothetical protein
MSSGMQPGTTRVSRTRGQVVLAGAFVSFLIIAVLDGSRDVLRAYPSPEFHADVREIPVPIPHAVSEDALTPRDFDGDGVADQLSNESFHMEPLFARATSGMVQVRSGATMKLLLAHAVSTPVDRVSWCGDADGNGTEDVLVEELGRSTVLGHSGRR